MKLKEFIKTKYQDLNPELKSDLEYLIQEILNLKKIDLHLGQIDLSEDQISLLNQNIKQLKSGVPLAYILKSQDFMGLNFYVDSRVLIPRPETEFLVDLCSKSLVLKDQQSIKKNKAIEKINILDAGAGSGCIGISLLVFNKDTHCVFIEKSNDAVEVLKTNLNHHKIDPSRYQIFSSFDDLEKSQSDYKKSLDLFISNPPYIAKDDDRIEDSVLKHEPSMALYAEDNGFYFLKTWSLKALEYLKPKSGYAIFEFGQDQHDVLQVYAHSKGINSQIILDQYQKPRFWKIIASTNLSA